MIVNKLVKEEDAKKKAKKLAEAVQYLKDGIEATEGTCGETEQVCAELTTALDAYEKDHDADALDMAACDALDEMGGNVVSLIESLLQLRSIVTGRTHCLK